MDVSSDSWCMQSVSCTQTLVAIFALTSSTLLSKFGNLWLLKTKNSVGFDAKLGASTSENT